MANAIEQKVDVSGAVGDLRLTVEQRPDPPEAKMPYSDNAYIRMATEAAWLNGSRLTERRKRKCALTSTGLFMEGFGILIHRRDAAGRRRAANLVTRKTLT
jgi:hypothetical protein